MTPEEAKRIREDLKKIELIKLKHGISNLNCKPISFEKIDTEIHAYLLGFFYADGSIYWRKSNLVFSLGLSYKDIDHLNKIAKILALKVYGPYARYDKKYNKYYINSLIRSFDEELVDQLISCGIYPRKSFNDRTTNAFDKIPANLKNHFIRGMFDGDGWIVKNQIGLCGINNVILEKINDELAYQCNLEKKIVTKYKRKKCYYFAYGNEYDRFEISNYLYKNATIFLDRKRKNVEHLLS